jgi:YjbE family integral membrane protein
VSGCRFRGEPYVSHMDFLVSEFVALGSVILIDLVLAGDNAIVVGMAACGLAPEHRGKVIALGILIALACRIAFALIAIQLLAIIGLLLAGGLLLLWVAWKLARELHVARLQTAPCGDEATVVPTKSFSAAVVQIAIADVSMSLDNVLAVAGVARHHMAMLAFGLALSVVLMGVAASFVAGLLTRYSWLSYLGLGIITLVAFNMIYDGGNQVFAALGGA